MARILITGAAGLIGGILRDGLSHRHTVMGLDRRRVRNEGLRRYDITRVRGLARAFEGAEVVIDLASSARSDIGWEDALLDCRGRVNVLEAAREAGVRLYVYASSNHVTGLYENDEPYSQIVKGLYNGLDPAAIPLITAEMLPRPDSPYAVCKVFGEAAARYYAEQKGLSCICLRIGTVLRDDRPTRPRHFATLLSHADLVRLVACAIEAPPSIPYGVYYGVSANRWRFWDIDNARRDLGYQPQDDTERFRGEWNLSTG
jgi:uronate dehydrogenase